MYVYIYIYILLPARHNYRASLRQARTKAKTKCCIICEGRGSFGGCLFYVFSPLNKCVCYVSLLFTLLLQLLCVVVFICLLLLCLHLLFMCLIHIYIYIHTYVIHMSIHLYIYIYIYIYNVTNNNDANHKNSNSLFTPGILFQDSRLFGPSPWKILATTCEQKDF